MMEKDIYWTVQFGYYIPNTELSSLKMQQSVSKRPGRPKSEQKAEAIRHAAADLFMTDGMERTSMDAIAAAAGVSKQTVYSHFKSKDDLFRACVSGKVQMYGLDASRMPDTDDVDAVLRHIGRQYLTLLVDSGVIDMFRLMVSEASTHPNVVSSFHEYGPMATAHTVADRIARHLPDAGDNAMLAARATSEYLALVRGDYFLELLLGARKSIPAAELEAHVEHCIGQLHRMYELS